MTTDIKTFYLWPAESSSTKPSDSKSCDVVPSDIGRPDSSSSKIQTSGEIQPTFQIAESRSTEPSDSELSDSGKPGSSSYYSKAQTTGAVI